MSKAKTKPSKTSKPAPLRDAQGHFMKKPSVAQKTEKKDAPGTGDEVSIIFEKGQASVKADKNAKDAGSEATVTLRIKAATVEEAKDTATKKGEEAGVRSHAPSSQSAEDVKEKCSGAAATMARQFIDLVSKKKPAYLAINGIGYVSDAEFKDLENTLSGCGKKIDDIIAYAETFRERLDVARKALHKWAIFGWVASTLAGIGWGIIIAKFILKLMGR